MSYKILIIDDDPLNIERVIHSLLEKNYNVLIATNAKQGCKIAINDLPNLIIMDWEMQKLVKYQ